MSLQHQRHDMSAASLYSNIMCFPAEDGSVRNLVVLYDAKHVAFYHYDHFQEATEADPNVLTLNFGNPADTSLFYTAPSDRRLVSVAAWGSCTSSYWETIAQASGILQRSQYPAQLLWLAVAADCRTRSSHPLRWRSVRCRICWGDPVPHQPLNHFFERATPSYRAGHPAWRCGPLQTLSCAAAECP